MAGSRKEYELLFKLQAALGGNFNAAFKGAINTTRQLQNTMQKLNSTTGKIEAFKKQSTALESNRQKLERLTAEHDRLQRELSQTEQPSEKLRAAMERNERQIADTTAKIEAQEARLRTLGDELSDAGVDTSRLTEETERLAKSYNRLKNSQEEMARLNAAIDKNGEALSKAKGQFAGTIGTIAALGAAIYAGPVQKSMEFQTAMAKVGTIADTNTVPLSKMQKEIINLSNALGVNASTVAEDVYNAISAGQDTANAVGFVEQATKLAKGGFAETGQALDVLTTILNAYGLESSKTEQVSNMLIATQNRGKVTVAELSSVMGKVIPTANANNVALEQLCAGYSIMTARGIAAAETTTYMNSMLNELGKSGTTANKALKQAAGASFSELMAQGKSLADVLEILQGEANRSGKTLADMFGSAEAGKAAISLMSNGVAGFNDEVSAMVNSTGAAQAAYQKMMETTEEKIKKAKTALSNLGIVLGDTFLPYVTTAAEKLSVLITNFSAWAQENPKLLSTLVKVGGAVLGLKAAGQAAKIGFLELNGARLTIQKGFEGIRTIFNLARIDSAGFSGALKGVAKNVIGYFGGIGNAAGGVGRAFTGLFSGTKIGNLFSGIGGAAGGLFSKAFSGIGGLATGAAGKVTGIFARAGSKIAAGPLGKIGGVVGKGFSKLTTMIAPLQKLGGAILGPFGGIAGKILPVVGVIGLIIAAVQIFRDHLDDIRAGVEKVFGPAGVAVFDNIVGVITNIGNTIKGIFSDGNLASAREFINGIFGEQGVAVFDTFVSIMQTVGGVIGQFISFIDTSVKPIIEELFAFIVTTVLPQIAQTFVEWGPTITGVIQSIWEIFQTVATAVMGIIQALMPTIQSLIGTYLEAIRSVIGGVLTAIQGLLNVFAGIFTGDWSRVWEGVKGIFSGVWEAIKGIAKGAMNGIIDIINGLIGGLNKLKIPDWVPGVGGKGINIPLIPKFAKGTPRTPDTFIAGEKGAELITNARNRTVFKAAETGQIFTNLAGMAKTLTGNGGFQQYRLANVGAEAPDVNPPTLSTADRQRSVVIHSAPVFHVGNDAQAQDIEEILRKHDEELLQEIDERDRQRADDERRRAYD
ncbi:phage tail tape measure protein [Lawsonibacter sp. JLR.KK007]|uniref:phage tail tape measure protein n=1 Tax=Lawsonibacter sp. JLR.KK007 TaxID=3114293 RepID=UPI002FF0D1D3